MTTDQTAIVKRLTEEAFNGGNVEALHRYVEPRLAKALEKTIRERKEAFPDLTYRIEHISSEGNHVVFTYTATGTHKGPFQGIEPTGREASFSGSVVAYVEKDVITDLYAQENRHSIAVQLGAPQLTGRWIVEDPNSEILLSLSQAGTRVTGSVNLEGCPTGKVTGSNVYPRVTLKGSVCDLAFAFEGRFNEPDLVCGTLLSGDESVEGCMKRAG